MISEHAFMHKSNYFNLILTSLKLFGIPIKPITNRKYLFCYNIYAGILLFFCIYYYLVAEIVDVLLHYDDFDYISFSLCYLIAQGIGLVKGMLIYVNRTSVWNYCVKLESGYFLPQYQRGGKNEFKFIKRATFICNFQAITFYAFVVIIVITRGGYAVFEREYVYIVDNVTNERITKELFVLPYNIYLPFDTQKYYLPAYIYQMFSCTLIGLYIGACDALITGIMVHVKAQIMILNNSLNHILSRACKLHELNSSQDGYKIDLKEKIPPEIQMYVTIITKDIVKHHQQIIDLTEETEDTFNLLMLAQFLGSLMLMCLLLFQLSSYNTASPKFFSMTFYFFLMVFQLLIYCWNGNELTLESLNVADGIYNSNWIQFNTDTQMALMSMMRRAQRPIRLSAGKFVYLSLETYTAILKGSASYFLALRKTKE